MQRLFITTILLSLVISCNYGENRKSSDPSSDLKTTTYYLIRHAEKDRRDTLNKDPELTIEGIQRAKNWEAYFKNVDLDQIYSTEYNRTKQTVSYIANSKKIKVQSYDPSKLNSEDFKIKTKGKTVLVVGHSNTTPAFVNAIIGEDKYQDMDDNDNASLYIVTVEGDVKKVEIQRIDQ